MVFSDATAAGSILAARRLAVRTSRNAELQSSRYPGSGGLLRKRSECSIRLLGCQTAPMCHGYALCDCERSAAISLPLPWWERAGVRVKIRTDHLPLMVSLSNHPFLPQPACLV